MKTKLERKETNQALFVYHGIHFDEKGKPYIEVKGTRPVVFRKAVYLDFNSNTHYSANSYIYWLLSQGFKRV